MLGALLKSTPPVNLTEPDAPVTGAATLVNSNLASILF